MQAAGSIPSAKEVEEILGIQRILCLGVSQLIRKRLLLAVGGALVFALIFVGFAHAGQSRPQSKTVYYRDDLKVFVNDRLVLFDAQPFIVDPGWIMVPVEFVAKELGASMNWDDTTSTFAIKTPKQNPDLLDTVALSYGNGDRYVGQVRVGDGQQQRDGYGTYYWKNGDSYTGSWSENNKHGQGTFAWVNGDRFVGTWRNGSAEGPGVQIWTNGNKYVGEYKNNMQDGLGIYQLADGTLQAGIWKAGTKVSP